MNEIVGKLNDGGPAITYPMLIILFVIIALIAKGIIEKKNVSKTTLILTHLGWFAVAMGFLGRTFGLIMAFDRVEASGELTPRLLAEGLKMALIDPLFGIFIFLVARAGLIAITLAKKQS